MKRFWFAAWPTILVLSIIGSVIGTPVFLVYRSEVRRDAAAREAEQRCGMYAGDIVEAMIDGRRGMVTSIYNGWVWVRFAQPRETTNVSLLGSDGAIDLAPYSTVRMACFELREVQSSPE